MYIKQLKYMKNIHNEIIKILLKYILFVILFPCFLVMPSTVTILQSMGKVLTIHHS